MPHARLDTDVAKADLLSIASNTRVKPFTPKTATSSNASGEGEEGDVKASSDLELDDVLRALPAPESVSALLAPEEFEKDNDLNYHVDFILACSNIRAAVYKINPVDRLKAKLIAGRVIPAIVTSTALICGYAAFEMLKVCVVSSSCWMCCSVCQPEVSFFPHRRSGLAARTRRFVKPL